jgi:condensin complex subunit 3
VEEGFLSDATSRNALYKIHVNLGKIVNTLDEQQPNQRHTSRSVSVLNERQGSEEKSVVSEPPQIKEEEEDSSQGTIVPKEDKSSELVEELLSNSDGDVDMTDV